MAEEILTSKKKEVEKQENQKAMRTSFIIIILACLLSYDSHAQVGRKQHVEEDGFVWYELTQNISQHGAENESGGSIVPVGDYDIMYFSGYFLLFSHNHEGIYSKDGQEVIPLSSQYEHVLPLGNYFQVERKGKVGVCDIQGEEIIPTDKGYSDIVYNEVTGFSYENSNGSYTPIGMKLDEQGKAFSFDVANITNRPEISSEYSDVKVFDLRGKVKSCEMVDNHTLFTFYTANQGILHFSPEGMLINIKNDRIKRDDKDRIEEIDGYAFQFDENNRVEKTGCFITILFASGSYESCYTYDSKGLVMRIEREYTELIGFEFTEMSNTTFQYEYLQFDSHGNWTERTVTHDGTTETEKRMITYY